MERGGRERRGGIPTFDAGIPVLIPNWCLSVVIGTSASSSSRRHRSTVKYQGVGLRARRYSETCFVLPTSSVRHLSHVEAHPFVDASRRLLLDGSHLSQNN